MRRIRHTQVIVETGGVLIEESILLRIRDRRLDRVDQTGRGKSVHVEALCCRADHLDHSQVWHLGGLAPGSCGWIKVLSLAVYIDARQGGT